ncbi:MAG: hypothetical protein KBF96_03315 [Ignavibacteria bacterium]|nr:hypothetical protein [Ignavibacteria bacterium]
MRKNFMLLNVLKLGPVSKGLTIEKAITNLNESTELSEDYGLGRAMTEAEKEVYLSKKEAQKFYKKL